MSEFGLNKQDDETADDNISALLSAPGISIYTVLLLLTWIGLGCYFVSCFVAVEPNRLVTNVDYDPNEMPDIQPLYGELYYPEIPNELVAATPSWNYKNEFPPLSVWAVLEIADQFRQTTLYKLKDEFWCLSSIELFVHDVEKAKWCWCVRFENWMSSIGHHDQHVVTFYVLMDGTVLDPVVNDGKHERLLESHATWRKKVLARHRK